MFNGIGILFITIINTLYMINTISRIIMVIKNNIPNTHMKISVIYQIYILVY